MDDSCDDPACEVPREAAAAPCPRCGETGWPVSDKTIQALLETASVISLLAVRRRFCRTPGCDVLYFGADGRVIEKDRALVRVGVKETDEPVTLCYCFGFSRADVRREIAETGASTIPVRISAEVRAGRCACEVKNPSGRCCLGEVNKAVKDAQAACGPTNGRRDGSVP